MQSIADFLVGTSDMLVRTDSYYINYRLTNMKSEYKEINTVISTFMKNKLYKALYHWIDYVLTLFKNVNSTIDEFVGVFMFSTHRSDVIIDLIRMEMSDTERELFVPLERAGILNSFLDWLMADREYSRGIIDHRFASKSVDILIGAINLDFLFSWYRQGVRVEKTENREENRLAVALWAVDFLNTLLDCYNRISLSPIEGHVMIVSDNYMNRDKNVHIDVFRKEDPILRWILCYKWFVQLQMEISRYIVDSTNTTEIDNSARTLFVSLRNGDQEPTGCDNDDKNASIVLSDTLSIYQRRRQCIENLSETLDTDGNEFMAVLHLYIGKASELCDMLDIPETDVLL